jgi:hypothetical protein
MQTPEWNGEEWMCGDDADTTYSAGNGLDLVDNFFSLTSSYQLPQGCTSDEIPRWSEEGWVCGQDADTTYDGSDFAVSGVQCPQGQFMIAIKTDGTPQCTGTLTSPDGNFTITLTNSGGITLQGPGAKLVVGASKVSIDAAQVDVLGTATAVVRGGITTLGGTSGCMPAVRVGDMTNGFTIIGPGSTKVLVC